MKNQHKCQWKKYLNKNNYEDKKKKFFCNIILENNKKKPPDIGMSVLFLIKFLWLEMLIFDINILFIIHIWLMIIKNIIKNINFAAILKSIFVNNIKNIFFV